jgi:broad specificity phosphatase PhoE
VVRHGTTTLNKQNRYRGRREVPLDEQGWRDAHDAAEALSGSGLVIAYCSPNQRTRDTASVIAERSNVPVEKLEGLYNLDYGAWEGLTAEEAAERYPEEHRLYRERPLDAACPGGEGLIEAANRMLDALRIIGRRHPGLPVAAVSHAVMVRLAVAMLTGMNGPQWRIPLATGSITRFEVQGDTIKLASLLPAEEIELEEAVGI